MTETINVVVEGDYLERLVRGADRGLAELIWNAVDADSSNVSVEYERNMLGGIEMVRVTDDGDGITPERARLSFGALGGSWKKGALTTEVGRSLHGRNGHGRWSAFGIGNRVQWVSVSKGVTEPRVQTLIEGARHNLNAFSVGAPAAQEENAATGTVVTITELDTQRVLILDRPEFLDNLTAQFALYLEQYPVQISVDSAPLDPRRLQTERTEILLPVPDVDGHVKLTVIEWSSRVERAMYLCDGEGVALTQVSPGIQAPGFEFTAFLTWSGFKDNLNDVMLTEL